jgi:hypothetical protein
MRIPLALNMPVFKEGTPDNLRKLPIRSNALPYLEGYESEEFCLMCRQIVTMFDYQSSLSIEHQLKMAEWDSRSIFLKLKQYIKGVKRPVAGSLLFDTEGCPCCGNSVFLEENEPCYDCEEGVFVIDEKFKMTY